MGWFSKKKDRVPKPPYTGTDRSGLAYREERIREVAAGRGVPLKVVATLLDFWMIHPAISTVGDGPEELTWTPSPIWDDEWMLSRESFHTEEEALKYVSSVGGTLYVS